MTVKEIAKIAGVSPSAVSVVLNGKKGVSEETRKRILEVINNNNYIKSKKTKTNSKNICFLKYKKHGMLVEQNEGFINTILDAIEAECRSTGYHLGMINSVNDFEGTIKDSNFDLYDGVIVLGTELEETQFTYLNQIKKPFIVLDNAARNFPCNSIAINNEETVYCALSHLAELGHKSIAYFHSSVSISNFEERYNSFINNCKEFNFEFKPEHQFNVPPTSIGAYGEIKNNLSSLIKMPSCAFADNDSIAIGAIKALQELGYRVPEDISIIGFDDIRFAEISSPPLTTMRIPKTLIGTLAVRQIRNMIEVSTYSDVKLRVGGKFVLRSSTVDIK
jgi:DNA-binding LacI/PurR family transcriptional regulator